MSKWYKTQHYNFDPGDETETITGTLWKNDTTALYLYLMGSNYCISSTLGSQYMIDSSNLTTYFYKCGGYRYFSGAAGYLWYNSTDKWCISVAPNFGTGAGDEWWKCSTLVGTYAAQGTATGTKVVTKTFNGWQKANDVDAYVGVYSGVGTETGTTKTVGYRTFLTSTTILGTDLVLFTETDNTHGGKRYFTGTWYVSQTTANLELWWNTDRWVISSEHGVTDPYYWKIWSANAAINPAPYWRIYTGTAPQPESFTLTQGAEATKDIYLTEVGTWL